MVDLFYDDSQVRSLFSRLNDKLTNPKDFLEEAGVVAAMEVQRNFDRATDKNGNPWVALKPSTIARKHSSRILVDTGKLKRIGWKVIGRRVEIGSEANYGALHQYGGVNNKGATVPQREWLYLNEAATEKIVLLAKLWLQGIS